MTKEISVAGVRFMDFDDDSPYSVLRCPRCPADAEAMWLHQGNVGVWLRSAEDSETGIQAQVSTSGVHVTTGQAGNPSSRRDGIRIDFECEWCGGGLALFIAQRKGLTLVNWKFTEATP